MAVREIREAPAAGAEVAMGGWGSRDDDSTWTGMDEGTGESPAAGVGLRRPTAYGLPPVTERTSNLRATISDVLTTKAPAPLIRLANRATDEAEVDVTEVAPESETENVEASSLAEGEASTEDSLAPSGPSPIQKLTALTSERPELVIGAAFLGGLLLATIVKRLARR